MPSQNRWQLAFGASIKGTLEDIPAGTFQLRPLCPLKVSWLSAKRASTLMPPSDGRSWVAVFGLVIAWARRAPDASATIPEALGL
jgi:hypothetical protein